jgi:hypothetical protein
MVDHNQTSQLTRANQIGFMGDAHGNLEFVVASAELMKRHGVTALVVLGDFGFLWRSRDRNSRELGRLSAHLVEHEQTLFFVDGNHENFDLLQALPLNLDGSAQVAPAITYLPRGYRTKLSSDRSLAVLGGANSIDREYRVDGVSWWQQESITSADLEALGSAHADVMIGHDAPLAVPPLDAMLESTASHWSAEGLAYSDEGRRNFHKGFLQVRPTLYLGGHYHYKVDELVRYESPQGDFDTRVIVLGNAEGPAADSVAILDVHTLAIDYPPV